MISTGSKDLNKLLEGYSENNITTIYGEGASGKTTLCLLAAIEQALKNKKVLFIDTEQSFSTKRFQQLLNNRNKDCMDNILILNIKNFTLQHREIKKLENIKNISLIIVDSITHFYRRLYRREPDLAKAMLGKQLSILNKISKNNIPVIVTSQVYSDMKKGILPLAKDILKRFSKTMIKLENNPRRIIGKNKRANFEITNEGIKII